MSVQERQKWRLESHTSYRFVLEDEAMWEKDAAKYTKTTVALALAGLKKMAKILANTMSAKRYPELRISVCKWL